MSFAVLSDPRQPEVHASTVLALDGKLLSAWFGGSKEGHPDTKIWLSTCSLTAAESRWTDPYPVAAEDGLAHWNPVLLYVARTKTILLFYKVGSPISSWYTKVIESEDLGKTWSKSRELVPGDRGGRGPVKNKPLILSDGTIIAPASIETSQGKWDSFTDISYDDGKTWIRSKFAKIDRSTWPGEGAIQPALVTSASGKMAMLARSSAGFVARSDSEDNGRSWGEMYLTTLPNNNSGLDALVLENGTWVVACNPVQQRWGPRTPLVISSSIDDGKTWKRVITLEDKPPATGFTKITALDTGIINDGKSEFSYPAIISDGEGGVHVSYTFERIGVKHVHLNASQISQE